MPRHSSPSILCFELTTFSTTWGICFSLEANSKRYNPTLFGTLLAQCFGVRAPAYEAAALYVSHDGSRCHEAAKSTCIELRSIASRMRPEGRVLAILDYVGAVTVQTNSPSSLFVGACVMNRIPRPLLVLGRLFYMIYDEDIYRSLLWYEFQSELLLHSF
jgi:hypothetical protein